MSKVLKKQAPPLKFDTSSANIGCFIRGKSNPKGDNERSSPVVRNKKRGRNERQKNTEFHDKAFLESVVCKILNDVDCQGITELIQNMVFPGSSTCQLDNNKDNHCEFIQQEEISHIFSDFTPFNKYYLHSHNHQRNNNGDIYRAILPGNYQAGVNNSEGKYSCKTTIQSTLTHSPREEDTNPEMGSSLSNMQSLGYGYAYYTPSSYSFQRQPSQRKRRTASGQQNQQYKIIPDKIQNDGRTTLMIRHIPNKYSQEMLYEQIGRNHKMKINFLYLPIDQYNSCNVGYAFVNFIHAKFIIDFYKQFCGRRWDRFNSQKICELAYARIQGTTNLMDHFHGNQLRGRPQSKTEQRKGKASVDLDEAALNEVTKALDFS